MVTDALQLLQQMNYVYKILLLLRPSGLFYDMADIISQGRPETVKTSRRMIRYGVSRCYINK